MEKNYFYYCRIDHFKEYLDIITQEPNIPIYIYTIQLKTQ